MSNQPAPITVQFAESTQDNQGQGFRAPRTPAPAVHKFRATVRKVIHLHRTSVGLAGARGHVGAEPGIDVRRDSAFQTYGHLKQKCDISVIDYSSLRSHFSRMSNAGFVNAMDDVETSHKPSWAKVRWINIGGVSWDVINAVATRHKLHPLALENILNPLGEGTRSKADYFSRHLFIRILSHTLAKSNEQPLSSGTTADTSGVANTSPTSSVKTKHGPEERTGTSDPIVSDSSISPSYSKPMATKRSGTDLASKSGGWSGAQLQSDAIGTSERDAAAAKLDLLKQNERVQIQILPMFIFLFRNGTVISLHPTPSADFTAPIIARLRQRSSGLRQHADPSLLVYSLLDLVVDHTYEIVDAYQGMMLKLECHVLQRLKMRTVRSLHILSEDLIFYKRTLDPIKAMVFALRRYDLDKCAALVNVDSDSKTTVKVEGYLSHNTKTHLADVYEHMDRILASLETFQGMTENMINYVFNMVSYEMNSVMRQLTIVTIICLPLGLLTGYFGMNFSRMWSVQAHSDVMFWAIAFPLVAIVVIIFMVQELKGLWQERDVLNCFRKSERHTGEK